MSYYQILSRGDALRFAENLVSANWEEGKARTKKLTRTTKQNEEILSHGSLEGIGRQIISNPSIQLDHLPLKAHTPKFSRYHHGMHYKRHTDAPWMGVTRTDLSCTLWLSEDYEGGELIVDGKAYKGSPGQCLIYDCGAVHEVTPVTSGERICVVTWIESRIRDIQKRQLVSDFRKLLGTFEDDPRFLEGSRLYSKLLRMWTE